jgi:hypothetical protein
MNIPSTNNLFDRLSARSSVDIKIPLFITIKSKFNKKAIDTKSYQA